ncbi:MAG: hypothetical protein ACE362_02985 [Phaeodactylibacter xiamenensis]|uniref:DUF5683 domain-containing protein n=1 Tax=Phaeodactylibacter xiamenensis TaxID=1524460 RepID=A0A098S3V1_9BACT|nr:hypothetical protein [Phaeodactylibacter xiamenensis]KGE85817.1 hypothetical protein IX84_24595 [Phaeodactylibacter xiamenensis]MCR9051191.1 hypothetical protein [bacterium]
MRKLLKLWSLILPGLLIQIQLPAKATTLAPIPDTLITDITKAASHAGQPFYPSIPTESFCLDEKKGELLPYKKQAASQLKRIKEYFEVLVAPDSAVGSRRKRAVERRIRKYLGSLENDDFIPYEGFFLDENLEIKSKTTSVGEYIRQLQRYREEQAGLVNVCWSLNDTDTIQLEATGFKDKIGRINGRVPPWAEFTKENKPRDYYCVYYGEGYIREEVTFFKNNLMRRHIVCKKMSFYLRYLETKADDGSKTYGWRVYIARITDSKKGECKDIKSGECPPPLGVCDSSIVYTPVPAWTYLVPGKGWDHFAAKERKVKPWHFITGITAAGFGYGVFKKIRSNRSYNKHLDATTLRELDIEYKAANNDHHDFLIATGAAALVWLTNDLLIFKKDRKQKRLFDERFGCEDRTASLIPEKLRNPSLADRTQLTLSPVVPASFPALGLHATIDF